jgi:hypothetical protein
MSDLLVKAIRVRVRNPQSLVYAARIIFFFDVRSAALRDLKWKRN